MELEATLQRFFGYDVFRPLQRQIVEEALQNRDVLVIMPTGGGKSLCYQLPALLKPGLTVVVSPLISLMQDQVNSLRDRGIGATFLNSSLNLEEIRARIREILSGRVKLLYVAPERLLSDNFAVLLTQIYEQVGISTLAIDEAHCVSEWGHDFRPEYRQIKQLRHRYPQIPMLALTATATTRVRQDIIQQLQLRQPSIHVASFNRPNLYLEVVPKGKLVYQQILKYIQKQIGPGIIYCSTRRRAEEIAARLQVDRIPALAYHGGMGDELRTLHQERFLHNEVQVMVATVAFGMGINKPDIRFVFHHDLPRSLENYYQEIGRAGRDGHEATCILFYSKSDVVTIGYLIKQKGAKEAQRLARQHLSKMIEYAESSQCRRTIQLNYFGEKFPGNCQNCDNCLNPQPLQDWTIEAQKFLSCVARCQERFGMNHIIDVLTGSTKTKIEQYGHHLLSTYGIGKDISVEDWRKLGQSLIYQGLVNVTNDEYQILKLNKQSWEILRSLRTVCLPIPKKNRKKVSKLPKSQLPHQLPVKTEMITLGLYQQGLSVKAIAETRNLKMSTIYQHLAELIALNQPVDIDSLVSPTKQTMIKTALLKLGMTSLSPVKEYLGNDYTYEEIMLVRAWLQRS